MKIKMLGFEITRLKNYLSIRLPIDKFWPFFTIEKNNDGSIDLAIYFCKKGYSLTFDRWD
jgi:hypothetical protein